jgi:hypothetical protein
MMWSRSQRRSSAPSARGLRIDGAVLRRPAGDDLVQRGSQPPVRLAVSLLLRVADQTLELLLSLEVGLGVEPEGLQDVRGSGQPVGAPRHVVVVPIDEVDEVAVILVDEAPVDRHRVTPAHTAHGTPLTHLHRHARSPP